MKKKEIVIIAVIIGLALMLYLFIKPKNNGPMIKVVHGDKTVDLLDINVDNIYTYQGDYGVFHVEVKDGRWRAVDVECPTQECVHVGRVDVDHYWPIVCLPNGYAVMLEENK